MNALSSIMSLLLLLFLFIFIFALLGMQVSNLSSCNRNDQNIIPPVFWRPAELPRGHPDLKLRLHHQRAAHCLSGHKSKKTKLYDNERTLLLWMVDCPRCWQERTGTMWCTRRSAPRGGAPGAAPCEIIIIIVIIIIIIIIILTCVISYAVYFVVLLLCGDWTLLNVFLAIACDSLDQVGGDGDEGDAVDGNNTIAMMRVIAITR